MCQSSNLQPIDSKQPIHGSWIPDNLTIQIILTFDALGIEEGKNCEYGSTIKDDAINPHHVNKNLFNCSLHFAAIKAHVDGLFKAEAKGFLDGVHVNFICQVLTIFSEFKKKVCCKGIVGEIGLNMTKRSIAHPHALTSHQA